MLRAPVGLKCLAHAAIIAVLAYTFLAWALPQIYPWPYVYDEADYMFVATQNVSANYLDSPSQSLAQFLRMGLTQGGDPSVRGSLSEYIRESGDLNFYRHWHGPLYFFWLHAVAAAEGAGSHVERVSSYTTRPGALRAAHGSPASVRRWVLVFPLLTMLVIYFGALWIFRPPVDLPAAVLSSALYLWSFAIVRTNELAPHQLYVLWYVIALILLAKLTTIPGTPRATASVGTAPDGNEEPPRGEPSGGEMSSDEIKRARRLWYAAVVFTGAAFATMEIAFTLVATLAIVAWREREKLGVDKAWTVRSVLLFVSVSAALWPMGVFQLNAVKSYLFMAYLALFRDNPWGNVTHLETWQMRLTGSPAEWAIFAAALILFRLRRDRSAFPAFVYSLVTFAAMLRVNTDTLRYMLPFLAGFHILAGFVLGERLSRLRPAWRAAAVASVVIVLWANTARQVNANPVRVGPRERAMLDSIREREADGRLDGVRLVVPADDLPMVHYYFPRLPLRSYATLELPAVGPGEAAVSRGYPVLWRTPPAP